MIRRLAALTGILLVLSQPAFSQQAWYEGGTLLDCHPERSDLLRSKWSFAGLVLASAAAF